MVESPFAALRLRTDAAKRFKKVERATAVIWKMLMVAQMRFRRLNAQELLARSTPGCGTKTASRSRRKGPPREHVYTPIDGTPADDLHGVMLVDRAVGWKKYLAAGGRW